MVALSGPDAFPFFIQLTASKAYFLSMLLKVIFLLTENRAVAINLFSLDMTTAAILTVKAAFLNT